MAGDKCMRQNACLSSGKNILQVSDVLDLVILDFHVIIFYYYSFTFRIKSNYVTTVFSITTKVL